MAVQFDMDVRWEGVAGGASLAEALSGLSQRVTKRLLRDALTEAIGEPMRQRMGSLAPHEPGPPDIRDAMTISNARLRDEVGIYVGPRKGFFYGYFQEFGTQHHRAQPFVRPAFDSEGPKGLGPMGQVLWRALSMRGTRTPDAFVPSFGGSGSRVIGEDIRGGGSAAIFGGTS